MSGPYIPRQQGSLLVMARNAAGLLSAAPYRFGITPDEAGHFAGYVDDFAACMAVVASPVTKTKATVQAKEISALRLLMVMRPLFQTIKMSAGVDCQDKIALGVPVGGGRRKEVPAPATAPVLEIVAATRRQHVLRFHDAAAITRHAKPHDAVALELLCQVAGVGSEGTPGSEGEEIGVEYARPMALVTRQPYVATFTAADVGWVAHYWGRWVTRRGRPGPWSVEVSMTVAG